MRKISAIIVLIAVGFVLIAGCTESQPVEAPIIPAPQAVVEQPTLGILPLANDTVETPAPVEMPTLTPENSGFYAPGDNPVVINSKGGNGYIQKMFVSTPEGWSVAQGEGFYQVQPREAMFLFISIIDLVQNPRNGTAALDAFADFAKPQDKSQAFGRFAITGYDVEPTHYVINGINARFVTFHELCDVTQERNDAPAYIFEDGKLLITFYRSEANPVDLANVRKIMETYRGS